MKKRKIYLRPDIRVVEVCETVGMLTAQTGEISIDDFTCETPHKTHWINSN